MAKRANGEGSIFKRKDGRWQGDISLGYDQHGKRRRETVYGRTQREVREKIDRLKREVGSGSYSNTKLTLTEYLDKWHAEGSRQWRPRTAELYRHYIDRHIVPKLGKVKLAKLAPLHVQSLVGELADEGHLRTANACRTLLASALKQAVRWQLVPRNVVEAVDAVKEPKTKLNIWTPEQTAQFLEGIQNHRLYAAFYLMIATGVRRGELLGLRWEDVQGDTLNIEQSLVVVNNKAQFSTPKTERGIRRVAISPDVVEVLKEHRKQQSQEKEALGESWTDFGLVFASEVGTPIHPRNFYRTWRGLLEKTGVPPARLHDLRHLHVSLLINKDVDQKTIADRVGHTDPGFTLRHYGHLFEKRRRKAAMSVQDLLKEDDED